MLWLIVAAVLLPLSLVIPARPDKQRQRETFTSFWARHAPRRRRHSPRKVALAALSAHGNTIWWACLLVWPTIRSTTVGLWWATRLVAWMIPGLAHMALKLTRRALKTTTYVVAHLWAASEWLVWHVDQLIAEPDPSDAPQLATA